MKSWKTSLCGFLAIVCTGLAAILPDLKEVLVGAAAVLTSLGLYFAKDSNVTGGTTPQ